MMNPNEPSTPGLLAALEAVSSWREAQEEEAATQLAEVDAEELRLLHAIADLTKQSGALEGIREQIKLRTANLDQKEILRSHRALMDSLQADRHLLEERAAKLQEQSANDRIRAQAMLEDPELAEVVREYEGFAKVEEGLSKLPPSYRKAIQEHHNTVKRRLRPVLELLEGAARPLDAHTEAISLVASVEPVEGPPQALALVLPVDSGLYYEWEERPDNLSSQLAYRVVAAASELARRLGAPDAPITFTSVDGNLTVQLWLADHEIEGDLREAATGLLDVTAEAPDFGAAKIEVYALWLPPSVLSPPESDEDLEGELSMDQHSGELDPDSIDDTLNEPVPGSES
ncbi:MAG: hypothetical protein ACI9VR_005073 [Cognaticolwellia sp.]|jgi:hypothetical protein